MIPTTWFKMTQADADAMATPVSYIKWIIDKAREAGFLNNEKELSANEAAAIHTANSPSISNPFATIADIPASSTEYIPFIATQNIPAYSPVTSTGQIANSSTTAHRNKVIGIATATVNNGFSGNAKGFGTIINPLWTWTIGDRIFLNGTSLSTIAPLTGFIQIVGTATATDTIDVKLSQSILL